MVIPSVVLVVDDCSSKTSRGVDTSSGDRDGGQVDQENREPNWQRSQNLHFSFQK
ncbi:hypothetical protein Hanom_Chr17g01524311 [Helianthus anomalus]